MAYILTVGNCTLDIINQVDHYPEEDEEMRCRSQRMVQGGNAANTATVLSLLGHKSALLSTLADDAHSRTVRQILQSNNVILEFCSNVTDSATPTSYIILNQQNGSRTIVHYRDLAELDDATFSKIPVEQMDWIHFEGRNINQLNNMMLLARSKLFDQPISLEIEKPRDNIESLISGANIILFSRVYALAKQHSSASSLLHAMHQNYPDKILVCSWGKEGAWAVTPDGELHHSPAFPPATIIDTVGAGDTFNAGIINAMCSGKTVSQALTEACKLAGRKISGQGFAHLKT